MQLADIGLGQVLGSKVMQQRLQTLSLEHKESNKSLASKEGSSGVSSAAVLNQMMQMTMQVSA